MQISFIIPCYNEEEGIPPLCDRLRALAKEVVDAADYEVIFVDDGSTDKTIEVIGREATGLSCVIIQHERNKGITAALMTGFAKSKGEEIVTLDSDCTYDPLQSVELLRTLRKGYDVVTGSPYHPEGEVVGVQGWRLFLSKSLSRLYWLILPQRLYTYTSCFRAYRREALLALKPQDGGFLGVTQLLVSAILRGYRIAEIPSRLTKRQFGQSKIRVVRVIISHVRYLLYVTYLRLSGRNFGVH
jgi:dolichol-phosphate mannosyltransferase